MEWMDVKGVQVIIDRTRALHFLCVLSLWKKTSVVVLSPLAHARRKPRARRQEEHALDWVRLGAFRRGAGHPLTSSVRHWFRLSFLHTFFGLAQFCKKPCNLVFNVLLEFFYKKKNLLLFFIASVLGTYFSRVQPTTSLCRKCSTIHCHTIRHWTRGFIFKIFCRHKVKKDKNLKTLWQNNAVLRRAALSAPKPAPHRVGR